MARPAVRRRGDVGPNIASIGRFLRALNVDMAKQRLRASQTILNRFHDQYLTIQRATRSGRTFNLGAGNLFF
jgi:hypothetical protein